MLNPKEIFEKIAHLNDDYLNNLNLQSLADGLLGIRKELLEIDKVLKLGPPNYVYGKDFYKYYSKSLNNFNQLSHTLFSEVDYRTKLMEKSEVNSEVISGMTDFREKYRVLEERL